MSTVDCPPSTVSPRERRIDRVCHAAAIAVTVGWFLGYNHWRRDGLVDEPTHVNAIYRYVMGTPGWPDGLPILPGYHFIVTSLWRLMPSVDILDVARLVACVCGLLALAAFSLTWRQLHRRPAGPVTLLLALLPLVQPFNGMAYTDVPGLAFTLGACWAQATGRRRLATVALVGATAIRQTNVIWAGLLIVWEWLRPDAPRREFFARIRWLLAFLLAAGLIVLATGRLTVGTGHANELRPNPAAIHFGGLLILLLGLPIWLAHAPAAFRRFREYARRHRGPAGLAIALGVAAAAVLAVTFSNPHIWNRDLFWEGTDFTLLRNWPLVLTENHAWLRVVSGIIVVLMVAALAFVFSTQRLRRELWLATGFGLVPVLTNNLIEPRYFIPGVVLVLLFFEFDTADWRRLLVWWGFLSLLHAPFIAAGLSLW